MGLSLTLQGIKTICHLCSLIIPLLFIGSCSEGGEGLIEIHGQTQGTYYSIKYLAKNPVVEKLEFGSLFASIDASLSIYRRDSLVSKFNRELSITSEDPQFLDMFLQSQDVYTKTNGYFDPTVLPLVKAWGFGPEGRAFTSNETVESIMNRVGWNHLSISNPGDGSYEVRKDIAGVELDFNAIAQGYTVDLVSSLLEKNGIKNYLIDIGGEIKAKGRNSKEKFWTIGIDRPIENLSERKLSAVIELNNMSVATSGNYRKFYLKDGVKYSHTISPKTGKPVSHNLLSASVVTKRCSLADAYATAIMAMGFEMGKTFVESMPGVDAYFIYSDKNGRYNTYTSKGLRNYIKQ